MILIAHRQLTLDHCVVGPNEEFEVDEETALSLEARGLASPKRTFEAPHRKFEAPAMKRETK